MRNCLANFKMCSGHPGVQHERGWSAAGLLRVRLEQLARRWRAVEPGF